MKNNRLILMISVAAAITMLPLIAMQFTAEVNWSAFDFTVMGLLLFATVLLIELVLRTISRIRLRIVLCLTILVMLIFVWADLAIGITGMPFSGS